LYFALLAGTLGLILLYVAKKVKQPYTVTVAPLAISPGTAGPGAFIDGKTQELRLLNFSEPLDFTVPELPHKGWYRVLFGYGGDHAAFLAEIEAGSGKAVKSWVNFAEFKTVLDNGVMIQTNNSPFKQSLSPPPHIFTVRYPSVSTIRELFDKHRLHVEQVRARLGGNITSQKREKFAEDFETGWEEVMQYQIACGTVRRSRDNKNLTGTVRLVARALSPESTTEGRGLVVTAPIAGALVMGLLAWSMPSALASLDLQGIPYLCSEIEAGAIVFIALAVGYVAGSGGGMLGLLTYVPTVILFESGPIGHIIPVFLAFNSGMLGEKLRQRADPKVLPIYKYLSPELYVVVVLFLLAGLNISIF